MRNYDTVRPEDAHYVDMLLNTWMSEHPPNERSLFDGILAEYIDSIPFNRDNYGWQMQPEFQQPLPNNPSPPVTADPTPVEQTPVASFHFGM